MAGSNIGPFALICPTILKHTDKVHEHGMEAVLLGLQGTFELLNSVS